MLNITKPSYYNKMKDSKGWKFGELIKVDELGKQVGADTIQIDEYSIRIEKGGETPPEKTEE